MKTRILSIFVVLAMVISFLPQKTFAVEENSRTYVYDNFTIDYNITDSWDDTQNITINVTNTGIDSIENWMLAYDFNGEIHDIQNFNLINNSYAVV